MNWSENKRFYSLHQSSFSFVIDICTNIELFLGEKGEKKKLKVLACCFNNAIVTQFFYRIKGESFWRNCGAVSVGEHDRVIKYYQLSL